MPEKEDEFTEFADDFTDRWLVNSSEDELQYQKMRR